MVFPARAGMILEVTEYGDIAIRIPRESGDDPIAGSGRPDSGEYSPRERG